MKRRMQWLIGALAIVCAVTLYSVYLAHFRGHRESGTKVDNWEEYWSNYYFSVGLALDALQARHESRTNDYESLLAENLFDGSLKNAIRFYDDNGKQNEADKSLKTYIYRCVIDEAAAPRQPDSTSYDAELIALFRRIAAIQPIISHISIDPEVETSVARFIEKSICEYETFASQSSTNPLNSEYRNCNNEHDK